MTWLTLVVTWLTSHRIQMMSALPPAKTQRDYDDEQQKLDAVWRRIERVGHSYFADRSTQERTTSDE